MGFQKINIPISEFMETVSKSVFGRSRKECWEKGICINCGLEALPRCYSDAGRDEYRISCLCEPCFDEITGGGE